ncbi:MAG: hypothetical protein AAFV25_11815 [Bacteroidota bacterium]
MSIIQRIFGGYQESPMSQSQFVEAQSCPNCWGKQSYGDEFVELVNDRQKDIINKNPATQKAFVEKFIEERLTGIRLKKDGDRLVCRKCTGGYKTVSGQAN